MSFDNFPHIIRLYNRLTDARANLMDNLANIDSATMNNLDAPVSLTAKTSEVTLNTVWTSQKAGYLDAPVSSVKVKSINHYGPTTLLGSASNVDQTITAVARGSSVIHASWSVRDGSGLRYFFLTDTTVRFEHVTDGSANANKTIYFTVVEYA